MLTVFLRGLNTPSSYEKMLYKLFCWFLSGGVEHEQVIKILDAFFIMMIVTRLQDVPFIVFGQCVFVWEPLWYRDTYRKSTLWKKNNSCLHVDHYKLRDPENRTEHVCTYSYIHSGQIIATSQDLTPNGGDCKGNPRLFQGKSRLVKYYNLARYMQDGPKNQL